MRVLFVNMASTSRGKTLSKSRFSVKQAVAKVLESDEEDVGNQSYDDSDLEVESDSTEDDDAGTILLSLSLSYLCRMSNSGVVTISEWRYNRNF